MRSPTTRSRVVTACAGALLALAALTACSGGASDSAGSSAAASSELQSSAQDPATAPQPGADARSLAAGAASGHGATVDPAVADLKVVRRADLSVRVREVEEAAQRVRQIAADEGGVVESENISTDPGTPVPTPLPASPGSDATVTPAAAGTITVSVPADHLDATLDRLTSVGTVLSRSVTTDNVTTQYADTDSRVKSARASVDRVRALMSRADKLGDVVTLEAELSRREADLEALESQLASLKNQVALSPVTVRLTTPEAPPSVAGTGFLAGLAAGWQAFTGSVTVLLTALGALLPFALAAAVVLVPALLWWRRRSARGGAVAVPPPAPPVA